MACLEACVPGLSRHSSETKGRTEYKCLLNWHLVNPRNTNLVVFSQLMTYCILIVLVVSVLHHRQKPTGIVLDSKPV